MASCPVALDYRETHSYPLLSSTTCFTGARRQLKRRRDRPEDVAPPTEEAAGGGDRRDDPQRAGSAVPSVVATAVLATELHTLTLHLEPNDACIVEAKEVDCLLPDSVEGDEIDFSCVGFDVLDDEWQVVALMRRATVVGADETGNAADSTGAWRGGSMSDMTALLSVATSPEDASVVAQPPPQSVAAGTAADSVGATHRRSGSNSALEMNASSSGLSLLPPDQLQRLVAQSANPLVYLIITNLRDRSASVSTRLDFRPLAPTLCRLGSKAEGSSESVGVWLGSADDCKLRLYKLHWRNGLGGDIGDDAVDDDSRSLNLVCFDQCVLQEELDSLSFRSPVMALDWCHGLFDDEHQCVAAACQDGTIRLITYSVDSATTPKFNDVRETTVIVDGPIVCVSLVRGVTHVRGSRNFVQCLVGSLCGYACEIRMWDAPSPPSGAQEEEDPESSPSAGNGAAAVSWHGPNLVAQGLWDHRLNCEDSVLCVTSSLLKLQGGHVRQLVAIGTHAGRCRVYGSSTRPDEESLSAGVSERQAGPSATSYDLLWECHLPYSIHGVLWLSFAASSARECGIDIRTLLVTTRRSAHVFRLCSGVAYDANVALERLKSLMEEEGKKSSDRGTSHAEEGGDAAAAAATVGNEVQQLDESLR